MKKLKVLKYVLILIMVFTLLVKFGVADTYTIDTISTCNGFIKARMYHDDYNFIDCKLVDDMYNCPCSKNRKLILNTTIEGPKKVVYEFYPTDYNDPGSRVTREKFIDPSQKDIKKFEAAMSLEKRTFMIIVLVVLSIVGAIMFGVFLLLRKWYLKIKYED